MYHARVDTRAIAHNACARMKHCASLEPSKLLRDDGLRDPQYNQRPSKICPPHPRAVVDPHERRASVLVAQNEVDEAVNKAVDVHLEAETAHERSRRQSEQRQSNRELLTLRIMER